MKFVCSVCGYVHEGDSAPEFCPQCRVPASKFMAQSDEMSWAAEHVIGVAQGAPQDIIDDLRANYMGECTEVGMYLARSALPIVAPFSASIRIKRFLAVLSVTTSPRSSANLAACSASSQAAFSQ